MAENRYIEEKVVMPQPEISVKEVEEAETADTEVKDTEVKDEQTHKKSSKGGNFFMKVLGGGFLAKEEVSRQFPFLVYIVFLLMLFITNTYLAEDMNRESAALNKILEESHVEYIYTKSALMQETKQSILAKRLEALGIKESVEPLRKIIVDNEEEKK